MKPLKFCVAFCSLALLTACTTTTEVDTEDGAEAVEPSEAAPEVVVQPEAEEANDDVMDLEDAEEADDTEDLEDVEEDEGVDAALDAEVEVLQE
ncbi:MAG: hypothetical protein WCX61_04340 [Candidatus Peribacteraceae bacterium]|jgi:hypothetical protein